MRSFAFSKIFGIALIALACGSVLAAKPAVIGPDEAYLKWTCVTQFTDGKTIPAASPVSYEVARKVSTATTWTQLPLITGTAATCVDGFVDFLDTKLAKGTYTWNVRAVVGTSKSDASPDGSKVVPGLPPPSTKPKNPSTLTIEIATVTADIRGKLDEINAKLKAADDAATAAYEAEHPDEPVGTPPVAMVER